MGGRVAATITSCKKDILVYCCAYQMKHGTGALALLCLAFVARASAASAAAASAASAVGRVVDPDFTLTFSSW